MFFPSLNETDETLVISLIAEYGKDLHQFNDKLIEWVKFQSDPASFERAQDLMIDAENAVRAALGAVVHRPIAEVENEQT